MRMSIMKVICTLLISVVMRVTSEAEEKRSIFSNEKLCMRSKHIVPQVLRVAG